MGRCPAEWKQPGIFLSCFRPGAQVSILRPGMSVLDLETWDVGCPHHRIDQLIYSCLQFTQPLRCCNSCPEVRTMIERIAILGTGLLGTSLGMALRAAGFNGSLAGWNRSAEGAREALAMGAVDLIATDAIEV